MVCPFMYVLTVLFAFCKKITFHL